MNASFRSRFSVRLDRPTCRDPSAGPRGRPPSTTVARGLPICVGLALLALLGPPPDAVAQEIEGELVERGAATPIAGATVRLLDEAERERGATLSDEAGEFRIEADAVGTYVIEVQRVGFETWRSEAVELGTEETVRRRFEVPVRPVSLEGLVATGRGKCRVGPREGRAMARLWEEIRKALEREVATREERRVRYHVRRFDRVLDAALTIETEGRTEGWTAAETPYRSAPVEELVSRGFVVRDFDGQILYRAPDADVILSDEFQRTHCFGITRKDGRVGLTFRPLEDRQLPEVEGTFWVDGETARLEELEFEFVHLDMIGPVPEGAAKGRVEFEGLQDGRWIVRRWWIRWPKVLEQEVVDRERVARSMRQITDVEREESEPRIARYEEEGGEVLETEVREAGQVVGGRRMVERGTLTGMVYDSLEGGPLAGVTVRLEGANRKTRTDPRGFFTFQRVPAARYAVTFEHPGLSWLGEVTEPATAQVTPGFPSEVRLATPGPVTLRDQVCQGGTAGSLDEARGLDPVAGEEELSGPGAILGTVRLPGEEAPAAEALVAFDWGRQNGSGAAEVAGGDAPAPGRLAAAVSEARTSRAVARTDSAGRFVACGLPVDEELVVRIGSHEERIALTADRPLAVLELEGRPAPTPRLAARTDGGASGTVLMGFVRTASDGRPIQGARVQLLGTEFEKPTKSTGLFRFEGLAPGAHRLTVEHLGHQTDTVEVSLQPGVSTVVQLELPADPVELPEITASVERTIRDSRIRDFYRRMESGNGRFLTGEEVERYGWIGAFRRLPSVTLEECTSEGGARRVGCYNLRVARGGPIASGCPPTTYIDGVRVSRTRFFPQEGQSLLGGATSDAPQTVSTGFDMIRGLSERAVEGVEIHDAGTVPPQYGGLEVGCGVVLVWTKR